MSAQISEGMRQQNQILIVEDSPTLAILYQEYLRPEPVTVTLLNNGSEALQQLQKQPPHAMILDLYLPDMNGMEILHYVIQKRIPTAVVVVTGHGSVDIAVEAMRTGAFDFLEKPFTPERLLVTVRNALERQHLSNLVQTYKQTKRNHFHGFIGTSPVIHGIYHMIESAAPSRATVFITGESGTGKELCAEAIHDESERRKKPFVALNCAAIPHDLMESEIFGHVKGAFTGAHNTRQGAAGRADKGTLFLDEVCEMDLDLQSKLLRFIQSGSYQVVGSNDLKKLIFVLFAQPIVILWKKCRPGVFGRTYIIVCTSSPLRCQPSRNGIKMCYKSPNIFCVITVRKRAKNFCIYPLRLN